MWLYTNELRLCNNNVVGRDEQRNELKKEKQGG